MDKKDEIEQIEKYYKREIINKIESSEKYTDVFAPWGTILNRMVLESETHRLILKLFDLRIRKYFRSKTGKEIGFSALLETEKKDILECASKVANNFKMTEIRSYEKEINKEMNFILEFVNEILRKISFMENITNDKMKVIEKLIEMLQQKIKEEKNHFSDLQNTFIQSTHVILLTLESYNYVQQPKILIGNYLKNQDRSVSDEKLIAYVKKRIEREYDHKEIFGKISKEGLERSILSSIPDFKVGEKNGEIEEIENFDKIVVSIQKKLYDNIKYSIYENYLDFIRV